MGRIQDDVLTWVDLSSGHCSIQSSKLTFGDKFVGWKIELVGSCLLTLTRRLVEGVDKKGSCLITANFIHVQGIDVGGSSSVCPVWPRGRSRSMCSSISLDMSFERRRPTLFHCLCKSTRWCRVLLTLVDSWLWTDIGFMFGVYIIRSWIDTVWHKSSVVYIYICDPRRQK